MADHFADPITVVISKDEVLHCDPQPALAVLRGFIESARHPAEVRARLGLAFHGYDADPRELWEIDEVRDYVRALDGAFPFWFYVADLRSELLKVLAFSLCRSTVTAPGATSIHQADFATFLERHFGAMNELLDHWHVPDEESRRVTEEIVSYYTQARITN